jgi:formylglycine-generating enzyme required for sulfatase activity
MWNYISVPLAYSGIRHQKLLDRSAAEAKSAADAATAEAAWAEELVEKRKALFATNRGLPKGAESYFEDRHKSGVACERCPRLVLIPAGEFMMGASGTLGVHSYVPARKVKITKPFAIGAFEVSNYEYLACIDQGGCTLGGFHTTEAFRKNLLAKLKEPADWVPYRDIVTQYLPWLSEITGQTYRLPSEAEWEYAARAGSQSDYWWGDSNDKNRYHSGLLQRKNVGSFPPNRFGLYDIVGNAGEYVADRWHDNYSGAPTDGSVWDPFDELEFRKPLLTIVRGAYPIVHLRERIFANVLGTNGVGFRVVRELRSN